MRIGVIDYGMGNLHSAGKALSLRGDNVVISDSRARLADADLLVLPGVGSFGAAMTQLAARGLDDFVRHWIADGRPYLGICLGLQLLFERSEEDRGIPGLGVLRGRVTRFRPSDFPRGGYEVPHMGWNQLRRASGRGEDLFKGIDRDAYVYFVHTYYAVPRDPGAVLTETVYGRRFCSAVARGSAIATQFHLEKSGDVGLRLLENIVERARRSAGQPAGSGARKGALP